MSYTNTDQPECQSIRRSPFTPVLLSLWIPSFLVLLILCLLLSTLVRLPLSHRPLVARSDPIQAEILDFS